MYDKDDDTVKGLYKATTRLCGLLITFHVSSQIVANISNSSLLVALLLQYVALFQSRELHVVKCEHHCKLI